MASQRDELELRTDVLVVGSGPGGSLTAALLAEAGRDVLMLEEGPDLPLESCPPFSRAEMVQKYRRGGMTVALGRTRIAYVEGRCVGGGSEINSGLYHRPPPDVLEEWRRSHRVEALTEADLRPHCEANERDLSVATSSEPAPPASLKLHAGANRLGWRSLEVPRWFAPAPGVPGGGVKQSMTRTFIPRALAAGARLRAGTRAVRLERRGGFWRLLAERAADRRPLWVEARSVVLACGATETPALLRRSGLGRHVGRALHLHPTVKATAEFDDVVNPPGMGVPAHQVKQFSPRISLGCSISAAPHLVLAMLDGPLAPPEVLARRRHLAVYYAMTRGGTGSVVTLPLCRAPLVRYRLAPAELAELAEGLRALGRVLLAAGARVVYPSLPGGLAIRDEAGLATLPSAFAQGQAPLMTIHLFSSCPMGEDRGRCVADSFGRVHGASDLWIADASLLPGPPGVNPQGTIMAIARRNAERFLDRG